MPKPYFFFSFLHHTKGSLTYPNQNMLPFTPIQTFKSTSVNIKTKGQQDSSLNKNHYQLMAKGRRNTDKHGPCYHPPCHQPARPIHRRHITITHPNHSLTASLGASTVVQVTQHLHANSSPLQETEEMQNNGKTTVKQRTSLDKDTPRAKRRTGAGGRTEGRGRWTVANIRA